MDIKEDDFNYEDALITEVNDGCIKRIWRENATEIIRESVDEKNNLMLSTGRSAIIEFANGKKMLITNSEWCSLSWD